MLGPNIQIVSWLEILGIEDILVVNDGVNLLTVYSLVVSLWQIKLDC